MRNVRTKVKLALVADGITLAQVCRRHGLNYERMVKILAGMRRPNPHEAQLLAVIAGTTVDDLFGEKAAIPILSPSPALEGRE